MLAVVQRVLRAAVAIEEDEVSGIGPGLLILLSVSAADAEADADFLASKIARLRVFRNGDHPLDLSLLDAEAEALVVSQFTLHGDCRKGRRPDFTRAAGPGDARRLYDLFVARLRALGVPTQTGVFGAMMRVSLVNDGPVTLIIKSPSEYRASG